MATGVQPSKFINYISQFKKVLVTRNNGVITQTFKIDSSIDDNYYFSIVNSNNQLISLEGRVFRIYGSLIDTKQQMHILFYSDRCTIENGTQMHFKIETYTSQYMSWVKSKRIIDLTIVEVANPDAPEEEQTTQVVLRDEAIAYKRPYIENQTPTEILQKVILTTNVPLTGAFGSGQDIDLTIGSNGAAFGTGLTQTGDNQLVIGQYNEADATKAFIIGNGENDTVRSNLFTIDYEGNIQTPGAISANAITVNGQDVGDKVNQLENTIEAVSAAIPSVEGFATEQWVQDQGYLTAHQDLTAYATKDWVEGKGYITGVNLDPYATKDQLTAYATKTDLTVSASVLNNQISQLALDIPTKVSDLTNDSGFITGYNAGTGISISNGTISLTGEVGKTYYADNNTLQLNNSTNTFSIKSLSSKLNQGQNILLTTEQDGSVTINAIGGGGGGTGGATYLAGLGLGLSTVSAEDAIYKFYVNESWLNNKINTATSGIQNLSAGTGLEIEDNVISLTAQIPSIDGLASEQWVEANFLSAIPSNYATKDYVDSSVSGKADLSSVYTKEEVYTYIETDAKINEATSGKADLSAVQAVDDKFANYYTSAQVDQAIAAAVEDIPSTVYTGEDGIKVEDGVISLTATLSSITNDAGFITSAEIPTSYVQQSELESVSGQLTNAIGAKANTTQVEAEFTATSAWANETFLTEHQSLSSYYTKSEVDSAIGTATNDMATQTWVEEQGYLTAHQSLDDYYNKTQVDTISSNIVSQIPTDVATSAYVQAASGNAVSVATGWVDDQNYLTEVPSEYITETELATELEPYALSADVTTAITNVTSGKADQSTVESLSTALSTAIDTKANSADVYTKSQVYTKGETDSAINTSTSGKVNKTDFDTVTGALSSAIDTKTTSGEVKTQIEAYGYQNAADVANAISGKADKSELQSVSGTLNTAIGGVSDRVGAIEDDYTTSAYVTGQVNNLATGAVATNTANIGQLSTDLGTVSGKANANETAIGTLSTDLGTANGNISTLSTDLGTVSGKANTNADNISSLSTRMGTAEGNISTLSTGLGTVSGKANTNADNINTISGNLNTVSGNLDVVSGKVDVISANYVTSTFLVDYVNNQYVAVSQLANDVGYITAGDFPAGTVYLAGEGLKLQNAVFSLTGSVLSGDGSTIAINNNVISVIGGGSGGKTYTGGTGIEVDNTNDTISLTATIPTKTSDLTNDSGFITDIPTSYALKTDVETAISSSSGAIVDVATGAITVPTKISDLTNDSSFATSAQVSSIITGFNYITGITVSYNDEERNNYTVSGTGIDFVQNSFEVYDYGDNIAHVQWKGLRIYNESTDETVRARQIDFSPTDFNFMSSEDWVAVSLANPIPLSTSQLTNDSGYTTSAVVSAIASAYAQGGGGGGTTYTAGTGIAITNDEISVDQTWFENSVSSLVSSDMDAAASAAVESYITASGLATGTGLYYDDTDNSLNINLSADANSNMVVSADNNGVVWLSAVNIPTAISDLTNDSGFITTSDLPSTVYDKLSAGSNITLTKNDQTGVTTIAATGGGGGSTYTAGDYISLESDTIAVTGLPSQIEYISSVVSAIPAGAEQTNQKTISTGFTYDSKLEIAKNTYTPTDGVVTLSAFEVPAGSLDSDKVATFEEWVYVKDTLTGFVFDGVTLTNELPSEISQTKCYVFTRRILGSGEQYISYDYEGINWLNVPLTFKGKAATNAVCLSSINSPSAVTLNYSKNGGEWTAYTIGNIIELSANETVAFSGNNSTFNYLEGLATVKRHQFVMTGTVEAKGNIQSLVNFSNTISRFGFYGLFVNCNSLVTPPQLLATTLNENCYENLFSGCVNLSTAPALPATTIAKQCYRYMFYHCPITKAPQLPATGLVNYCYHDLFNGCTFLTTPPKVLPATTLANSCYAGMFEGCTNLKTAPNLPATGLAESCYDSMFYGCSNLSTAPQLPATGLARECYKSMFWNCTSLSLAPQLPATELAYGCYNNMFYGCTSLTEAPQLPATYVDGYYHYNCYGNMFQNCSNLSSINVAFTEWVNTSNWVKNVAANGTFTCPTALGTNQTITRGNNNCPTNWTVVNK